MKKINHVFILLLSLSFFSCTPVAIENYCDWVVVYKGYAYSGYFIFKKDTILSENVYLLEYDYNRYELGDTIKCKEL